MRINYLALVLCYQFLFSFFFKLNKNKKNSERKIFLSRHSCNKDLKK